MKKVLVTYQIPKEGLVELSRNFTVDYPDKLVMTRQEILEAIPEYDALMAAGIGVDKELIDRGKKLKIIANYGAGYDKVDVAYATEKGIVVTNTPDAVTEATAEIAFGLMLAVMRRISECDRRLRTEKGFRWGMMNHLGRTLYGKTLGIIGMGRIGRAVAKRALVSGMKILYHNRKPLEESIEQSVQATYVSLHELLAKSDVISIHTPLTDETYHLIGRNELEKIKPSAYLINTSRGAVIDEKALVDCLKEGKIAGAGLDVFEHEPVITPELLDMDQVVLLPHIGTEALESRTEMAQSASQSIMEYFAGEKPVYTVNPEVFQKSSL